MYGIQHPITLIYFASKASVSNHHPVELNGVTLGPVESLPPVLFLTRVGNSSQWLGSVTLVSDSREWLGSVLGTRISDSYQPLESITQVSHSSQWHRSLYNFYWGNMSKHFSGFLKVRGMVWLNWWINTTLPSSITDRGQKISRYVDKHLQTFMRPQISKPPSIY